MGEHADAASWIAGNRFRDLRGEGGGVVRAGDNRGHIQYTVG